MRRLRLEPRPVAVDAVAVVASGGFLSESAPLARLVLPKGLARAGEKGDRPCVLLSYEQRNSVERRCARAVRGLLVATTARPRRYYR